MTEQALDLTNPAWDIIKDIPGDDIDMKYLKTWRPDGFVRTGPTRSDITRRFTWAIPAPESIEWIVTQLNGRKVVEIGAGTGYWAWMLSQAGVDVNAYDLHPPIEGRNDWHCPREDRVCEYTDEERQKHYDRWKELDDLAESIEFLNAALPEEKRAPSFPRQPYRPLPDRDTRSVLAGTPGEGYHSVTRGGWGAAGYPENLDRVLFLCWPPYDDQMAVEALRAYSGDTLIYIGEGQGGCTGNDDFFELLSEEFEEAASGPLYQWTGIHDRLSLYQRLSDG